jgi:arginyl-tRNA synthetase
VVDADDLMAEMIQTAKDRTLELGKIDGFTKAESTELFHNLGLGALKYFLLKVEPKKRMLFNPEESIDFQGNTGPFIQYTHSRICSILRKGGEIKPISTESELTNSEQELIYLLGEYKTTIAMASANFAPSVMANYAYDLAKTFNKFYNEMTILSEENEVKRNIRLTLAELTGKTIQHATSLLGIVSPNRM